MKCFNFKNPLLRALSEGTDLMRPKGKKCKATKMKTKLRKGRKNHYKGL